MVPTHYHINVFGRIVFVTLRYEGNKIWLSDGHKASTCNVHPITDILGKRVEKDGCIGTINKTLTDANKWVKESTNDGMEFFNSQVGVYWAVGVTSYWQDINKLKIL